MNLSSKCNSIKDFMNAFSSKKKIIIRLNVYNFETNYL